MSRDIPYEAPTVGPELPQCEKVHAFECPHCTHRYTQTWSIYLTQPTIKTCPKCQGKSKLNTTTAYVLVLFLVAVVFDAGGFGIGLLLGGVPAGVVGFFVGFVITMSIDRHLDERFRQLKPLPAVKS